MEFEFAEHDRAAGEAFMRLGAAVDRFEGYAYPHALRVAKLADALAARFRLSRADRTSLVFAALLHDIGEMAMARDYISRAGPLSGAERLDLARHPVIGEQEAARSGADRGAQLLVRWHHEWWNGTGYPDALRAEQIPLEARILRVADAYAALTDGRPFRPAGTEAEARKHLTLWAGIEFDPHVVHVFLSLAGLAELRSYARAAEPREALRETTAVEPGNNGEGVPSVADEVAAVGNEETVRKDEEPAVAES